MQSKIKVLLTVLIDYEDLIYHEFIRNGQAVNMEYNLGVRLPLIQSLKKPLWGMLFDTINMIKEKILLYQYKS